MQIEETQTGVTITHEGRVLGCQDAPHHLIWVKFWALTVIMDHLNKRHDIHYTPEGWLVDGQRAEYSTIVAKLCQVEWHIDGDHVKHGSVTVADITLPTSEILVDIARYTKKELRYTHGVWSFDGYAYTSLENLIIRLNGSEL